MSFVFLLQRCMIWSDKKNRLPFPLLLFVCCFTIKKIQAWPSYFFLALGADFFKEKSRHGFHISQFLALGADFSHFFSFFRFWQVKSYVAFQDHHRCGRHTSGCNIRWLKYTFFFNLIVILRFKKYLTFGRRFMDSKVLS